MGALRHGAGRSHFSRLHPVRLGGSLQSLTSTPVGQAHHSRTPALCQHSATPDLPTASMSRGPRALPTLPRLPGPFSFPTDTPRPFFTPNMAPRAPPLPLPQSSITVNDNPLCRVRLPCARCGHNLQGRVLCPAGGGTHGAVRGTEGTRHVGGAGGQSAQRVRGSPGQRALGCCTGLRGVPPDSGPPRTLGGKVSL